MKLFYHIGKYFLFMLNVVSRPDKYKVFYKQIVREIELLGINSMGIVAIISVFMGAVITIQTAYNTDNPLYPSYLIGLTARDTLLLEFSSTIVALILAGKIGSSIASEIGTMRVTEQIDALEIMGVNSSNYLVLPKIVAAVFFVPFLTLMSIFIGLMGGWIAGVSTGVVTSQDYVYGIQYAFVPYYVVYGLIKSAFFAFIITSISAYHGFFSQGGSLEVGKSSTLAVVHSCVFILLFNFILTQLLLS
jgi:phospholipid/cholesterol/gamma-HCH transport system permease protein